MWEPILILTRTLPEDDSCAICGNRKEETSGKTSWHCKTQEKNVEKEKNVY